MILPRHGNRPLGRDGGAAVHTLKWDGVGKVAVEHQDPGAVNTGYGQHTFIGVSLSDPSRGTQKPHQSRPHSSCFRRLRK